MSMDKLISDVKGLAKQEYGRASAKFGETNNSDHESYAVLLEELEEAMVEVNEFQWQINKFWELVKSNDDDLRKYFRLLEMERRAAMAAAELVQVVAMVMKATATVCARGEVKPNENIHRN